MLQSKQKTIKKKKTGKVLFCMWLLIKYFLPSCTEGGKRFVLMTESFSCLCTPHSFLANAKYRREGKKRSPAFHLMGY